MAYPVTIKVRVSDEDWPTFEDGMAGLNVGHAMWRARVNWDGCTIEHIGMIDN